MLRRLLALGALAVVAIAAALFFWRVEDLEEPPSRPVGLEFPPPGSLIARVKPGTRIALWNRPNGKVLRRIGDTTEFGSPEVLSPTGPRQGGWIAVRHTSLGNDGLAWIHAHTATLTFRPRRLRLEVDLSRRLLVVSDEKRVERRIPVAVGAPETPTPVGEYYVTDKLRGPDFGEFYGCCILALSGTQPNLPQGWSGGDRLAIHGSPTPTWGQNVSNGCFHARESDLRWLTKTVPLGTVVAVRA
jgi:hypothetical protein